MDIVLAEDECSTAIVDDLSKRFKKILKKAPEQIYLVLDDNEHTLMHIVKLNDLYHVIDNVVLHKSETIGAAVEVATFLTAGAGDAIYSKQALLELAPHRLFKAASGAFVENTLDELRTSLSKRDINLNDYKVDINNLTLFEVQGVVNYGVVKSTMFNAIINFTENSVSFYSVM